VASNATRASFDTLLEKRAYPSSVIGKENLSATSPPGERTVARLSLPPRSTPAIALLLMPCLVLFFLIFFSLLSARAGSDSMPDMESRAKGQPIRTPYESVKRMELLTKSLRRKESPAPSYP